LLNEVALTFRIVDKIGTQWVRRAAPDVYVNEVVAATDADARWTKISISLTDKKWQVFSAEGNHLYPKTSPDIDDMVLALVVEMGSDRGSERPGPGAGRIMLRNIRLSES
jgi:hypothetical protein